MRPAARPTRALRDRQGALVPGNPYLRLTVHPGAKRRRCALIVFASASYARDSASFTRPAAGQKMARRGRGRASPSVQMTPARLSPPVNILEAFDVVFPQLVAEPDLDHHGVGRPFVLEPVNGADRDNHGIARGEDAPLGVHGDGRGARGNDPAFGPVSMALQRQAPARENPKAFDDITGTGVEDGPVAPRSFVPLTGAIFIHRHVLGHSANDCKRSANALRRHRSSSNDLGLPVL
jgi:hypothetical protein